MTTNEDRSISSNRSAGAAKFGSSRRETEFDRAGAKSARVPGPVYDLNKSSSFAQTKI